MGTVKTMIPIEDRGNWKQPPTKEYWAISMIEYAQDVMRKDYRADAYRTLTSAIRILNGDYRTLEDGFAIEVEED